MTISLANWTNTPDPCPHSSYFLAGANSRHIILIQPRSLIFSIRLGPANGRPVPFMCTKHLSNFCMAPWQTAYSTQQLLERKEILSSSSCSSKREDILEWVPFRVWWTVYFNRAWKQRCTTSSRSIFDLEGCLMLLDSSPNSPMQVQVTTVARTTSPAHRWCQTLSPTFLIQAGLVVGWAGLLSQEVRAGYVLWD